jgi:UPF0755 protein
MAGLDPAIHALNLRVNLRFCLVIFLVLLVLCLTLGKMAINETYFAPGPLPTTRAIIIPPAGTATAAKILHQNHAITTPLALRAAAWATRKRGPIRAGEYTIPARSSIAQILQILRFAPPVEHQVTLPEGLTAFEIAKILNAAPATTGRITLRTEGSILPQTYDYTYRTPVEKIAARATLALQTAMAAAWPNRDPAIPLATPADAITLASIVQEETPLPAELPKIAAVYENRLRLNMRLQADPTVIYAATYGVTATGQPITRANLANPSPYNTYIHPGLPPGPICAPGLAAILAVLHPARSKNLYFVATGTGGHIFAQTYTQQLANIAAYLEQTPHP